MTARDIRYQAAVIEAGRLLLLQCRPHGEAAFWVLPGGGREAGESEAECVAREVREEANLEVEVGQMLYDIPADPPDDTYRRWRTYRCRVVGGVAAPGGGDVGAAITALRWLPLAEDEAWEAPLTEDPFLHPQLLRIRAAVGNAMSPILPP